MSWNFFGLGAFGVVGGIPRWQGCQRRIWVIVGRWQGMVGIRKGRGGVLWRGRRLYEMLGLLLQSIVWCVCRKGMGCILACRFEVFVAKWI